MIVRSYSGRTVNEALEKVRRDLGQQALIVETRTVRAPGLAGKRAGYEVVACADADRPAASPAAAATTATAAPPPRTAAWRDDLLAGLRASAAPDPAVPPSSRPSAAGDDLRRELDAIRSQLTRLVAGQGLPTAHLGAELAERLQQGELPDEALAELDGVLAQVADRLPADRREEFAVRYLARGLDCQEGVDFTRCRRLLVVGPTGVGKTTTIAKLAGDLVLRRGRKVGLVTIDTYRVGASDQLQAYADLLGVPCAVAGTPAKLAEALDAMADREVVLIDTAGRSPRDGARLQELSGFCRTVPGLTVMLVLPATCGRAEMAGIVERFSILPIEAVTVTKLDELEAPGRLLGGLRRHRLPVRYLTDGQEVPNDLQAASALRLARLAVERPAPAPAPAG